MKLCNKINEELLCESVKGFKDKFPELNKLLKKENSLDMAKDAISVTTVPTKGGDIFVIKTPEFTNYFHMKYGWVGESEGGIDHEVMAKYEDEFEKNLKNIKSVKITEAQHYNTKMRSVEEKMGSRRIRMGINEYKKMIENMLDKNHPSPNPVGEKDKQLLTECSTLLEQSIPRLKAIKETRRRGKKWIYANK